MSVILYWGDDEFAIAKAVNAIQQSALDPAWMSFNYEKIPPEREDAAIVALDAAMTPPFGTGKRVVWLADTTLMQQCSEQLLAELERTLPQVPATTILLLTSKNKPDGRLKSTKTIQKYANVQEFSLIPPWKTEELSQRVQIVAKELGLKLTPDAVQLLAESVGNNTRQLYLELDKLQLLAGGEGQQIDRKMVASLVIANTQNSLQLAAAIRQGDTGTALQLITELIDRNEPALKIVATLVGQFRTWLWVKMLVEAGEGLVEEQDLCPNRIFFIKQDLQSPTADRLAASLPKLLDLEFNLKRGGETISTLQMHAIELCQGFRR
ncbi:DNA polymerase III subunit delta [Chamaesiphon polymorphus]|uniref:DNA polymerase III subunit delta n=1 Tax=Chamaesiphon polymorphus CCALA 037 TaxID=2107692 RepID=A0A2T1G0B2_9CYAN|nr:DNA polymerase III subunit delta [Chamaesiphon polymorphus]PSB50689.1 DNA polymerase III subunit delta [Chamaesiphon polymorphus CCALA 037]